MGGSRPFRVKGRCDYRPLKGPPVSQPSQRIVALQKIDLYRSTLTLGKILGQDQVPDLAL